MRQRNALVSIPLLVSLNIINEDDEVLIAGLVVDLDLGGFSASHCCCLLCWVIGMVVGRWYEIVVCSSEELKELCVVMRRRRGGKTKRGRAHHGA